MNIGSSVYNKIVRCDFGYLHDDVDKGNIPLYEFQKLNVPNRYYEYIVSGLYPVALTRQSFCYQNMLVEKSGFVLKNISDLSKIDLNKLEKEDIKIPSQTFFRCCV